MLIREMKFMKKRVVRSKTGLKGNGKVNVLSRSLVGCHSSNSR